MPLAKPKRRPPPLPPPATLRAVRAYFAGTIEPDGLEVIRFGEFLVERRVITREQLLRALMVHHLHGGRLGAAVTRLGYCEAQRVEALASEYHNLATVDL
jgi:hypothetical protein